MSDFIFGCPKCNREFRILPEFAGEIIQCPHCDQKMRIPAEFFALEIDPADLVNPETRKPEQTARGSSRDSKPNPEVASTNELKPRTERTSLKSKRSNQPSGESVKASQTPVPPQTVGFEQPKPRSSLEKSAEPAAPQKPTSTVATAQLPPQFVTPLPTKSAPESLREKEPPGDDQANTEPVTQSGPASREAGSGATAVQAEADTEKLASAEADSKQTESKLPGAAGAEPEPIIEPSIAHLLPAQFAVLDPGRFRRQSSSESQVLLPTADGGVQTVSDRLVTIEYKGEKYVVVAMSPAQKRRRQIIANIVSVIVAIGAIVGTIWILLK